MGIKIPPSEKARDLDQSRSIKLTVLRSCEIKTSCPPPALGGGGRTIFTVVFEKKC